MLEPETTRLTSVGMISSYVMPNQHAALRPMSQWLTAELIRLGLPARWQFNMDLCSQEALTNIIDHAFDSTEAHCITLRLLRWGDDLALEIEDDGRLFNPLQRRPHTPSASVLDAPIGGLGVDIIRTHMDDCRYEARDGHNVLTLLAHGVFSASGEFPQAGP